MTYYWLTLIICYRSDFCLSQKKVLLSLVIIRGITRPTAQAVRMIEELGRGNLEPRLRMSRKDEIGRLAQALEAFADNLRAITH